MSLTRAQLQSLAKARLEAAPLFADGRVPVLTKYFAPGDRNDEREEAIRAKGACLEVSPVLRERKFSYKRPSLLVKDCTLAITVRLKPSLQPGDPALTLDTAVDEVERAMLGAGFEPAGPFAGFEPDEELAQLVEDDPGLLSTAIFFTARVQLTAA